MLGAELTSIDFCDNNNLCFVTKRSMCYCLCNIKRAYRTLERLSSP